MIRTNHSIVFCIFEDALSIPDWCHLNVVSGFSSTDSIYLYHLLRVICMKRTAPKTFLSNMFFYCILCDCRETIWMNVIISFRV